jgi:hypothetical protein
VTPDERRTTRELARALRELAASIRSSRDDYISREREVEISDRETHAGTIAALGDVSESLNAVINQRDSKDRKRNRRFQNRSITVQWCLFVATFLAFSAAAWYARIAGQQKDTMDKQWSAMDSSLKEIQKQTGPIKDAARAAQMSADVANASLVSVQRAYVMFGKNMQENPVAGADQIMQWEFRPRLENSGTTPTRNARNHVSFVPAARIEDNFQFPDLGNGIPDTPFVLGPKEAVTGALMQIPFQVVNTTRVGSGQHIFFWGWTRYNDVFPNTLEHITMFCIELTEVRGDLRANYNMAWELCGRHHNCVDDECRGEPYGTPTRVWR